MFNNTTTHLRVTPSATLAGIATPPSSKSQTIRALLFALMAQGKSEIIAPLSPAAEDVAAAIGVIRQAGAQVEIADNRFIINSPGIAACNAHAIHTGNSGITTRFIMAILGLRKNATPLLLDCGSQMQARPNNSLIQALQDLGMSIHSVHADKALPATLSGQLLGGKTTLSGITSQYLSALLMALPMAPHSSTLIIEDLRERPYVAMTLEWLDNQQMIYQHEETDTTDIFTIAGGQNYQPFTTQITGDYSSASYLIAAAVLRGDKVRIENLHQHDTQGDKQLLSILQSMGATIHHSYNSIEIDSCRSLTGCTIDASDIPDLLPTLAVIATQAQGETHLINVPQARLKETDRIQSMSEGLTRMGASIVTTKDSMHIKSSVLKGATVKGYDDHRTVMALAVAGMVAKGETLITDASAINKTFPTFTDTMQSLGAHIERVTYA